MPKTLLVFPPGWSPVGPYLALPVLKSYLQEVEQYKVDIVDLNVEFYDDLLSFRHVEECCKRYRESKDSFSSNVQLTIELIQKSALNVDEAKDIFRSKRYGGRAHRCGVRAGGERGLAPATRGRWEGHRLQSVVDSDNG